MVIQISKNSVENPGYTDSQFPYYIYPHRQTTHLHLSIELITVSDIMEIKI